MVYYWRACDNEIKLDRQFLFVYSKFLIFNLGTATYRTKDELRNLFSITRHEKSPQIIKILPLQYRRELRILRPNSTTSEMRKISREKVEHMRNMILECFSAKYFSSPGSWIGFYSVAKWK